MRRSASRASFTGEVTVDGGPADARLSGEVLHGDRPKAPLSEKPRGGANELLTPFGLHATAPGHLVSFIDLSLDEPAIHCYTISVNHN